MREREREERRCAPGHSWPRALRPFTVRGTTDCLFAAQMSNQVGILKAFDIFIILVRSSPASSPRLPLAQRAPASRQLARSSEAPA